MTSLERLYEIYNIIQDAKEDGSKFEAEYEELLKGVKGNPSERQLSSQFISKFFALFPNHQEKALNAQFDLCEDDEVAIRRQAIKELPALCKVKPEIVPKVVDILAQLMQMEEPSELSTIQSSMTALIKLDVKGSLTGLFYQIKNSEEETIRERCMKFLLSKLKLFGQEVFKPEAEELVLKECKAVLQQETSEEEFTLLMSILSELRATKSLKGHQEMVDLVVEQCALSQTLDSSDIEAFHRFSSCVKQALPFFSSQIRSTKFLDYMCREVLPNITQLDSAAESNDVSSSLSLDLLKIFAELAAFAGVLEDIPEKLTVIFTQLLEVMPLPPDDDSEALDTDSVSFEFSRVECLLHSFHQIAKSCPEFLNENADRLKDFRSRLQYFARGSHAYQKKLRESLADKKGEDLKTDENKIKLMALKTTANINAIIKDLFHQPPSYKTSIILSWKMASGKTGEKRHTPITFDSPNPKGGRQIYAPPRDKYSRGAGQFGRGRGRGRGGSRGFGYRGRFRGGNFRRY